MNMNNEPARRPPFPTAPLAASSAVDESRPHVFLHPGQVFAAAEPTTVTTIVGSCVSVCLWDRRLHIGGINHSQLPTAPPSSRPLARPFTFADLAMRELLDRMKGLGCQTKHLEAKVFGGAHLLGSCPEEGPGARNVSTTLDLLKAERIPVVARDLGGPRGRKITFHSQTHEVLVRAL